MEILGARPVWSMSDSEALSALDAAVAEEARFRTLRWQLTARLDASGYAQDLGAGDTARLLATRYRQDLRDTRREVRIANRLTTYPATSEALPDPQTPFHNPAQATPADGEGAAEGEAPVGEGAAGSQTDSQSVEGQPDAGRGWRVSPAQAAAIIGVLDQVPDTVPLDNLAVAEQELIGLAATHTPAELRRAGRLIRDRLDPDGPEPNEKDAYTRERLTLKPADRGLTFEGYLANENAELFRTLIHANSRPHKTTDGEPDPRPLTKRQADALTALLNTPSQTPTAQRPTTKQNAEDTNSAEQPDLMADVRDAEGPDLEAAADTRGSTVPEVVPGHGPKPHISITIDFNDLASATTDATGALIFGDNLSAATVRRLACDAEVLPIVLGSKSQPLDVGTTQRLVTRHMRRVLNARDKGCVVCGAPPSHCEAHHIIHWADGGITAVSNLALLCKRHHIDLHSGHWQIRILNGTVQVTRPTWSTPTQIPPNKYQPPTAQLVHQPPPPTPPPSLSGPAPDPWGDADLSPQQGQPSTAPRTAHDPWGDGDLPTSRGGSPLTVVDPARDPWGDEMPAPRITMKSAQPTAPWADDELPMSRAGAESSIPKAPWADEPLPTRRTSLPVDPWGDAAAPTPAVALKVVPDPSNDSKEPSAVPAPSTTRPDPPSTDASTSTSTRTRYASN
ncbi:DUF222 domain-containing protein [Kribbella sp. NPDC048928]|uniref:HNH endonuclease signature motif containing protein n=1 Tax=Kribbella sp. NPDC048928 TaxID=3364111 RepID=UPI003711890D